MSLQVQIESVQASGDMAANLIEAASLTAAWQGTVHSLVKRQPTPFSSGELQIMGGARPVVFTQIAPSEWKSADNLIVVAMTLNAATDSTWTRRGKVQEIVVRKTLSLDQALRVALAVRPADRVHSVHVESAALSLELRLRLEWIPAIGTVAIAENELEWTAVNGGSGKTGDSEDDESSSGVDPRTPQNQGLELGRGGYGVVRAARWLGADVAVKSFDVHEPGAHRTFVGELCALSSMRHPLIVQPMAWAVAANGKHLHLVMERVQGQDLEQRRVVQADKMSWQMLLAVLYDTARALAVVHRAGFTHGDVKPGNVLVYDAFWNQGKVDGLGGGAQVCAKLCDFSNCCRRMDVTVAANSDAGCVGTFDFCAPELLKMSVDARSGTAGDPQRETPDSSPAAGSGDGSKSSGASSDDSSEQLKASDIYSLAMTVISVVAGARPLFDLDDARFMHVKAQRVLNGYRPDVSASYWPEAMRAMVQRSWSGEPGERPSAQEWAQFCQTAFGPASGWPELPEAGADQSQFARDFVNVPVAEWSTVHVMQWLHSLELGTLLHNAVVRNELCGSDLLVRDPAWLKRRGVGLLGARKRMQAAAKSLAGYDSQDHRMLLMCKFGKGSYLPVTVTTKTTIEQLKEALALNLDGLRVRMFADNNENQKISTQADLTALFEANKGTGVFVRLAKEFGSGGSRRSPAGTRARSSSITMFSNPISPRGRFSSESSSGRRSPPSHSPPPLPSSGVYSSSLPNLLEDSSLMTHGPRIPRPTTSSGSGRRPSVRSASDGDTIYEENSGDYDLEDTTASTTARSSSSRRAGGSSGGSGRATTNGSGRRHVVKRANGIAIKEK